VTRLSMLRSMAAAAVVVTIVACGGGTSSRTDATGGSSGSDGAWHGVVLGEPRPRPSFTLTDTAGAPYDFAASTTGRLTLLFFGYTSCPDVCPIHMATLASALDQPDMPQPIVVFVTTDPARDTPAKLRSWLDSFDTDFVGLTGTPDEIAAAEQAAGVAGSILLAPDGSLESTTGSDDYEVGHAAQIVAYSPDDLAHLQYPSGVQRDAWVADLPRLDAGETPRAS
jgi:protein SCO1